MSLKYIIAVSNQSMSNRFSKRRWCQWITLKFIFSKFLFNHESGNFLSRPDLRGHNWSIRWIIKCRVALILREKRRSVWFLPHNQWISIWFSASVRSSQTLNMLFHLTHITFNILNLLINPINSWLLCLSLLWNSSWLKEIRLSIFSCRDFRN